MNGWKCHGWIYQGILNWLFITTIYFEFIFQVKNAIENQN